MYLELIKLKLKFLSATHEVLIVKCDCSVGCLTAGCGETAEVAS